MKIKHLLMVMGCAVLLCGCTKSNIVKPESVTAAAVTGSEEELKPDMNIYFDLEVDKDQLRDDVEDIYLNESDYPMVAGIEFELKQEEEHVDVTAIVKDGTSVEDALYFAEMLIKGINDEYAMQDFSYGESGDDTFGGLYQDNEIYLKVYEESAYESNGEPMYEVTIPKDTYMIFEIEE